jgi:hypothetical protein
MIPPCEDGLNTCGTARGADGDGRVERGGEADGVRTVEPGRDREGAGCAELERMLGIGREELGRGATLLGRGAEGRDPDELGRL